MNNVLENFSGTCSMIPIPIPIPNINQFDSFLEYKSSRHFIVIVFGNINLIVNNSCKQSMEPPPPNGVVIIQECFTDHLGSYVVFSPVNIPELKLSINGRYSSTMSLISSGFVISDYTRSLSNARNISSHTNINGADKNARSSLLTLAFQLLMSDPEGVNLDGMDVAVNSLVTTTINHIKDALVTA